MKTFYSDILYIQYPTFVSTFIKHNVLDCFFTAFVIHRGRNYDKVAKNVFVS